MERNAGRIILLWGWRRLLLAFLAGALAVLSAAPYDFFAVCFVSFPVLVWLLDGAAASGSGSLLRRLLPAFAAGWWFGFGYFVAGLWWVGNAMLVEAEEYAWAIPIGVLILPAILAVFYGLAAALARLAWTDGIGRIAALAASFGLLEWLRTFVFTGFPWNPIGQAAMPIPELMQSVAIVGMPGMNALAVFVFAAPALLASRRHLRLGLALAALVAALHAGWGFYRLSRPAPEQTQALAVRIVQPAVDQSEKWDTEVRDRIFKLLIDLSAAPSATGEPRPELIVWPETVVPFLITEKPEALVALDHLLSEGQRLLAGVVRVERDPSAPLGARYYNSVVSIDDAGEIVDAVDKVHLVPGGEYLPLAELFSAIGVDQIVAGPGGYSAGGSRHAMALPTGIRAVPFICYEIIFPELIGGDAGDADIIVNVTNDAWFGDSPGPYQHLRQAQIRAVETGKPVIRAANTGISAIIDTRGRILDALAFDTRGTLDRSVAIAAEARPVPWPANIAGLSVAAALGLLACLRAMGQRLRPN